VYNLSSLDRNALNFCFLYHLKIFENSLTTSQRTSQISVKEQLVSPKYGNNNCTFTEHCRKMQFSYCSSRWCLQQLICFKRVNNDGLLRGTCKSQAIFPFAGRRLLVTCIRIPSHRPITFPAVTGTDVHVRSSSEQYSQARCMPVGSQHDLLPTFYTS
jgi:hypothetical protein